MEIEGDDAAVTHGDTITCMIEIILEHPDGEQHAARGCLYWDATDPLVAGLHFECMLNSVVVTEEMFPLPDDCGPDERYFVTCCNCNECIPYGLMGALVPRPSDPDTGLLLCLMCADGHPATEMEEALWLVSLDELAGCLQDKRPAPEGAPVRIWRKDMENFQIALSEEGCLVFLTMPVDRLELLLEAIREYERTHEGGTEDYLSGGLAALERLANGESN